MRFTVSSLRICFFNNLIANCNLGDLPSRCRANRLTVACGNTFAISYFRYYNATGYLTLDGTLMYASKSAIPELIVERTGFDKYSFKCYASRPFKL